MDLPDNLKYIIEALRAKPQPQTPPIDPATAAKYQMMHDYFVHGKPPETPNG